MRKLNAAGRHSCVDVLSVRNNENSDCVGILVELWLMMVTIYSQGNRTKLTKRRWTVSFGQYETVVLLTQKVSWETCRLKRGTCWTRPCLTMEQWRCADFKYLAFLTEHQQTVFWGPTEVQIDFYLRFRHVPGVNRIKSTSYNCSETKSKTQQRFDNHTLKNLYSHYVVQIPNVHFLISSFFSTKNLLSGLFFQHPMFL